MLINFNKLIWVLLPIKLRTPIHLALLRAFLRPLNTIQALLNFYKKDTSYKLNHNGQVCYLEKMLNDRFDQITRRIYIIDGQTYKELYIYNKAELKPVFLNTVYIYPYNEFGDSGVDFIVYLNGVVLSDDEMNEIKALLNYYKLASKRYVIL